MVSSLTQLLLAWYRVHKRQLPWRGHPDAYATWVSEIMLQQTRVETVIPYFERWMKTYPTLNALAKANQEEVLVAWEGLGYYSRARNLHRAAQMVLSDFNGQIPDQAEVLCKLPGIGRYTAGAIASIAFGKDEPTLDGNIRRVLARIFNVDTPARSPEGERLLWELAGKYLPPGQAADYNQAWMDLGSAICTPRQPDCGRCPLESLCQARQLNLQEQRPVLERRQATPHYTVTAAVLQREGRVLITRRPENGLLGGMWEFPGGKLEDGEHLADGLRREICEELGVDIKVGEQIGVYRHAFTHFRITLHAFYCALANGEPRPLHASDLHWVVPHELTSYPMGKVDRQIARHLVASSANQLSLHIPAS